MKKNILFMLLGMVIATAVGVVATSIITAEQVNYDENTTVKDKIDDLYDKALEETTMDLLWTNPNPTAAFSEQTVSLNLNNYKYVVINATYGGNGSPSDYYEPHKTIIPVGTTSAITSVHACSECYGSTVRKAVVSTTGVTFGSGKWYNGSNLTNNSYAVPLHIWGIK